jgi:hypothetical protein
MKAKLVKRSNGRFDLYEIKDVDQLNTIASSFDNPKGKLSLKNCQAIELGYSINKLAENHWDENNKHYKDGINPYAHKIGYIAGFQKALELLSDKKFSEENLAKAYAIGYGDFEHVKNSWPKLIQSLQQDEWDVEIYTLNDCQGDFEKCNNENFTCVFCTDTGIPKLDEDNCLILKRI